MKGKCFFGRYAGQIVLGGMAALLLVGCKPTEKNYQAAYEVAQQKKKAESTDADILLPAGGLQHLDEPEKKVVDGYTVYCQFAPLNYLGRNPKDSSAQELREEGKTKMKKFCVAVAKYRMPTNCVAQVENLHKKGYDAFVAGGKGDTYFTIASSFNTLEEAAKFVRDYTTGQSGSAFVGLPSAPVIIERK